MPLRKSPVRTAALLAANRANALKSTGPRTPQGKARVSFNSFKHGRYAARPEELAERLLRAGCLREAALYRQVRWKIGHVFQPQGEAGWRRLDQLSAWVWCFRARLSPSGAQLGVKAGGVHLGAGTKPECAAFSSGKTPKVTSRTRIRVEDPYRRIGVVFWGTAEALLESAADRVGAGGSRPGADGGRAQGARRRTAVSRISDAQAQKLGRAIPLWARSARQLPPGTVPPIPAGVPARLAECLSR